MSWALFGSARVHGASWGAWLVLMAALWCPRGLAGGEFIAGADVSHLGFFEERGVRYRVNGQVQDALEILKSRGLTCARLRLFTSSAAQAQANPYNYGNNLEYTVPLAVRVKRAGLELMLDFHYSDSWADPGKQTKPAAWTNLTFGELAQEVRRYSSNCIAVLSAAGAMPDYVQVGNEVIGGMLWPEGRVGGAYDTAAQWGRFGQLLTNGIAGIRDAAGGRMPKVMIHIDRGGDWGGTQWFFDRLAEQRVEFDMIGQSYYPWWHGSFDALGRCLTNTAQRYGKPVVLAETAFPWTNSADVYGIPASPDGQVQFVARLAQVVKRLPGGRGAGVLWWGAEYQAVAGAALAGFDQRSFFDGAGNVLPVVEAMGQLVAPIKMQIKMQGTNLFLYWPLSGAGSSLLTSAELSPGGLWQQATNLVEQSGAVFSASAPLTSEPSRFFRLETN